MKKNIFAKIGICRDDIPGIIWLISFISVGVLYLFILQAIADKGNEVCNDLAPKEFNLYGYDCVMNIYGHNRECNCIRKDTEGIIDHYETKQFIVNSEYFAEHCKGCWCGG